MHQFTPEMKETLNELERELAHIRLTQPNRINTLIKTKCFSLARKTKSPHVKRVLQSITATSLSVVKLEEVLKLYHEVDSGEVELSIQQV
ncbi:hypothetical protein REBECCA_34 [Erwinia phage Rebecca]|uniref:Uncharacterized protein n=3 Tax=Agricanvirus TaxID=1984776 RepID=A0A191ZBT0_9CAUD|nr:hypothetical protein FDI00_gp034 [Erwinia phage vB_EamM_Special G]ANJ64844.1 hypothetical protein SPECIALG_34 [Erwinia phage vB_EamM_Special G]AUG86462.1 hypothetical protein MADMEL_34 [Erwinia phage vB_EamM_MadMel]QBP07142.1 hypothetical protein REBECCA_34 [Erwinia phage Rebecca]